MGPTYRQSTATQKQQLQSRDRLHRPLLSFCDHVHFHEHIREKQGRFIADWVTSHLGEGTDMLESSGDSDLDSEDEAKMLVRCLRWCSLLGPLGGQLQWVDGLRTFVNGTLRRPC